MAVVTDGKLSFAQAFGKADIANGRAADTSTRYAVGSISKQFTAAILLLLQEQGKLSLDDRVAKYFPDLTRANEISIRELLSHTAGYEDFAPQDYTIPEWLKPTTPQATMDRWAKKPLNFDPGTRWQYSNTNYVIAGAIAEKAAGEAADDDAPGTHLRSFADEIGGRLPAHPARRCHCVHALCTGSAAAIATRGQRLVFRRG